MENTIYVKAKQFSAHLKDLRKERERRKQECSTPTRQRLTARNREAILQKTGSRCHICGGMVGDKWHADHVLAHSAGGQSKIDNYLPSHPLCNNYRWNYLAEEFQLILKIGVLARAEIEHGTSLGEQIATKFITHELKRESRRRKT
jgi:5-methylcytosine-specific restriction endonuclease McrA